MSTQEMLLISVGIPTFIFWMLSGPFNKPKDELEQNPLRPRYRKRTHEDQ